MRRPGVALALLFLLSFGAALLPALPLRWALRFAPAALACEQPEGTPWSGHCGVASWRGPAGPVPLGALSWNWRPARLLRARLAFDLSLQRGPAQATALLQLSPGRLEVLDLGFSGPLDPTLLRGVPPGWSGRLEGRGLRLRLRAGKLDALDGDLEVRDLRSGRGDAWGSYQLHIPKQAGGGLAPGSLKALEGPLQLQGTLQLKADRSWQLDAAVAARPEAPADLARALEALGPPDAAGLRPLSIAGSY